MKYKFCPKCGSGLKEAVLEENHAPRLVCSSDGCGFVFYLNSSPAVIALITEGDRVLLGKRGIMPKKGMWAIPGGFLENGEDPETGLKREMMEELGVEIDGLKIAGIFIDTYIEKDNFVICLCYHASIKEKDPVAGSDIEEIAWFRADNIPPVAFSSHESMINNWLKNLKK